YRQRDDGDRIILSAMDERLAVRLANTRDAGHDRIAHRPLANLDSLDVFRSEALPSERESVRSILFEEVYDEAKGAYELPAHITDMAHDSSYGERGVELIARDIEVGEIVDFLLDLFLAAFVEASARLEPFG